ncbi:MAG: Slp family lipoprotein [Nitrospirae bacterium]|nr:Slp family lipoprotein [Nitrospirota bacterium]MDA8215386.1 Slp family lipoprotein [Nitrospiraceae bacterium]MDA8339602.1 Slp family lipoprotein [Nitrospiraceae bacterium]
MKRFVFVSLIFSTIFLFGLLLGCAHVVSKELRDMADKGIAPMDIMKDPDAYRGRLVIIGGLIASSINTPEGTYIEVVQKPLDYRGRPEDTDISHGRFIILYEGYLDTAIYSHGREVTVAGEVIGKMIRPLGQIQYPYLLLKSKELHLFEPSYGVPIRFGIGIWKTF